MASLLRWYMSVLNEKPVLTKSITSSVIMSCGDGVQQYIELFDENKRHKDYDFSRTARMGTFGLFFVGPVLHRWYQALERWFPGQTATRTLQKVFVDQTMAAPSLTLVFFGAMGLMEGKSTQQIKNHIYRNFNETMITNYKIWPAAIFIGFKFFPPNLRVLWSNTISLGFNTYLSEVQHRTTNIPDEDTPNSK